MSDNKYTGHKEWCMCDRCFGNFTVKTGGEEIEVMIEALRKMPFRPLIGNLLDNLEAQITPKKS